MFRRLGVSPGRRRWRAPARPARHGAPCGGREQADLPGRPHGVRTVEAAEAGATVARLGPFAPTLDGGPVAADADFCHPPLTTVAGPTDEAGRALVDVLLDDRAADPQRTLLPVQLRVRGSTGPAR